MTSSTVIQLNQGTSTLDMQTHKLAKAVMLGVPQSLEPVAGLSTALRALLSLQDGGIEEVYVAEPAALERMPRDARVKIQLKPFIDRPQGPLLVFESDTVWHNGLVEKLKGQALFTHEVWAFGDRHAALYALGAQTPFPQDLKQPSLVFLRPIGAEFVQRVDTPEARQHAEDLLLASLFKPIDGIVSRKINRRISLRITRRLLNTSVTPNQMTLLAGLFGLLGIAAVAFGGAAAFFWGALGLQLQNVLDGCDGEIARLKYLRSQRGEWLDQVSDDFINAGFLWAVGNALIAQGWSWAPWVTWITLILHTAYQASLYLAFWKVAGGRGSVAAIRWWGQTEPTTLKQHGLVSTINEFFNAVSKRDFFCFAYVPCALFGLTHIAFLWHALVACASGVVTSVQWIVAGGPSRA